VQRAQLGHDGIGHPAGVLAAALLRQPLQGGTSQAEDGVPEPALVGAAELRVQLRQLVEAPEGCVPDFLGEAGRLG
jgi:hypothetical protein